MFIIPIKGGL